MAYHMRMIGPIASTLGGADYFVSENHTEEEAGRIASARFAEDFNVPAADVTVQLCCKGPNPEREA